MSPEERGLGGIFFGCWVKGRMRESGGKEEGGEAVEVKNDEREKSSWGRKVIVECLRKKCGAKPLKARPVTNLDFRGGGASSQLHQAVAIPFLATRAYLIRLIWLSERLELVVGF